MAPLIRRTVGMPCDIPQFVHAVTSPLKSLLRLWGLLYGCSVAADEVQYLLRNQLIEESTPSNSINSPSSVTVGHGVNASPTIANRRQFYVSVGRARHDAHVLRAGGRGALAADWSRQLTNQTMTAYELRGLVGLGKRASARHRTHLAFHHLDFGWLSHLDLRRRILGLCWATRHQPSGYSTPSAPCARRTAASSAAPNP